MTYRVYEHALLAPYTTFRIGGPARWLIEVSNLKEIQRAIEFAKEQGVPYTLLAGGSNVLVADGGYPGVVINWKDGRHKIIGEYLYVEAGVNLSKIIKDATKAGLVGWESLSGIPGSIGGAVRGNAGAFGVEIKDFVEEVRALNMQTGDLYDFSNDACEFEYRNSVFKKEGDWIITHIVIKLENGDVTESEKKIVDTIAERERRHIQRVHAAGSFFKNPQAPPAVRALFEYEKKTSCVGRRVSAGWLIEKVGGKGLTIGGAEASKQHPNYIVNSSGDALASDVLTLAEQLHSKVLERYKIDMEAEVSLVGFSE